MSSEEQIGYSDSRLLPPPYRWDLVPLPPPPPPPSLSYIYGKSSQISVSEDHHLEHDNILTPHSLLSKNIPPPSYLGYKFTKLSTEHVGQKETWAIVNRVLMPANQTDLKNQVDKHCKQGITGLDQYNSSDMKGFKRKQIDELIRDCIAREQDHRFEHIIASIKRDTKRRQGCIETSTMQVILKRQVRYGVIMQGAIWDFLHLRPPMSGVVNLAIDGQPFSWNVDLEYHYNWTWEADSLSSGWDTSTSVASVSERSLPSDAGYQKEKDETNRTNASIYRLLTPETSTVP